MVWCWRLTNRVHRNPWGVRRFVRIISGGRPNGLSTAACRKRELRARCCRHESWDDSWISCESLFPSLADFHSCILETFYPSTVNSQLIKLKFKCAINFINFIDLKPEMNRIQMFSPKTRSRSLNTGRNSSEMYCTTYYYWLLTIELPVWCIPQAWGTERCAKWKIYL